MGHGNDRAGLLLIMYQPAGITDHADKHQKIIDHACCCNNTFQADVRTSKEVQTAAIPKSSKGWNFAPQIGQ